MAWARVDDGWWCHPKTMRLDLAARGLWVSALSWSCAQRTALVPPQMVVMLGADEATAKQIEATGLWHGPGHDCPECEPIEDGWIIHNWHEYQEQSLSEKRAEAGRKGGRKSRPPAKQTPSKPEATEEAGARPVPSPTQPEDQTPPSTSVDEPDEPDEAAESFEHFWTAYPDRRGRKAGKANALIEWRKLTLEQRRRAYIGAQHLAASDELPKDAERFLRRAKGGKGDFPFDDWQEPADPVANGPPQLGNVRQLTPAEAGRF